MEIYVIQHPKFEGWVKIGRAVNSAKRLKTYQTYCPERAYRMVFYVDTDKAKAVEEYFNSHVQNNGFEWFKCSPEFAINKINEIINDPAFPVGNYIRETHSVNYEDYIYRVDNKIVSYNELLCMIPDRKHPYWSKRWKITPKRTAR